MLSSRRNIPLPDELLQERERHVDDPRDHQGRIRSFPHERGNWASLLYVPCRYCIEGVLELHEGCIPKGIVQCKNHKVNMISELNCIQGLEDCIQLKDLV